MVHTQETSLLSVHPHMRGEYLSISSSSRSNCGSPPHAWGILVHHLFLLQAQPGSPPHAWGIPGVAEPHTVRVRFTPTCVGNTGIPRGDDQLLSVHPHMRGEYFFCTIFLYGNIGSPPHAWGIHFRLSIILISLRFTPTCVGNTPPFEPVQPLTAVHPHMRGEYASTSDST